MTQFVNARLLNTSVANTRMLTLPNDGLLEPSTNIALLPRPLDPVVVDYQPKWRLATLPYLNVVVLTDMVKPIRVGEYWLWSDAKRSESGTRRLADGMVSAVNARGALLVSDNSPQPFLVDSAFIQPDIINYIALPTNRAFFAPAVPHLVDCVLTLHMTSDSGGLRIRGGTVVMTVSVYASESPTALHGEWSKALHQAGYPQSWWNFIPQQLNGLTARLEISEAMLRSETQVTVNADSGLATFIIELSEQGALTWKQAFEQGQGTSLSGVCRMEAAYYGGSGGHIQVAPQKVEAALGALVASCTSENIIRINPQETFDVHLVVQGHSLLQTAVVSLKPSVGQPPVNQTFGSAGGTAALSITTQDVEQVSVQWHVELTFAMEQGWDTFVVSGEFSSATQWVEIINPASWLLQYLFLVVYVDDRGDPLPASDPDVSAMAGGVLTYRTASHVLRSSFDATHQTPVRVVLPANLPGQPFGDLTFEILTTRDQRTSLQSRRLTQTDNYVVVKIYPDSHAQIVTSADTLSESSRVLGLLDTLRQIHSG